MASELSLIKTFVEKKLSEEGLKHIVFSLLKLAEDKVPGKDQAAKEDFVTAELEALLKQFDNSVPTLGAVLNLPISEQLEGAAIRHLVQWAFLKTATEAKEAKEGTEAQASS